MSKRNRKNKRNKAKTTVMGPTKLTEVKKEAAATTAYSSRCHSHSAQLVFEANQGKTRVFAGSKNSIKAAVESGWVVPVLAVNLSQTRYDFMADFPVEVNAQAKKVLPAALLKDMNTPTPAIVEIDWDDYGVPIGLSKDWWQLMAETLFATEGDVVVCCMGGHGRTGTFLSLVAALGGACKAGDPVKFMRDHYCDSAVESREQVKYVERMTGRTVIELPSDGGNFPYDGYYGATQQRNPGRIRSEVDKIIDAKKHIAGTGSTPWTPPPSPGAEDYTLCQTGTVTGASVAISNAQEAYIAELEQEELAYSTRTEDDPTVVENGTDPESGDFIMDGIHYADEDDFIANEDQHNYLLGEGAHDH